METLKTWRLITTPNLGLSALDLILNKVPTFLFEKINQAIQQIEQAPESYRHQLIIVVVPTKQKQTVLLSELAAQLGLRYVNVNLELSRLLLDVPKKQQPFKAFRLLKDEVIKQSDREGLVLDHLEILFDPVLELDPLRCLLDLSRYCMVVARWHGFHEGEYLVYAEPGHPEYGRYQAQDRVVISVESNP